MPSNRSPLNVCRGRHHVCRGRPFQTFNNEAFYEHLRRSHRIEGSRFKCAKCDFRVDCQNWDPIIEHIKMHVLNIHICCVCSYYHHDRQKLFEHLKQEHLYRDVPIVTIIRSTECVQISIAIVFAQLRKTFSSTKSCFFCPENAANSWETYASHLKKDHFITLQYFCEICDESLQLTECDDHFSKHNPTTALRIRCQFATNNHLYIDTVKPLKLRIESCDGPNFDQNQPIGVYKSIVKQEPCDNESDSDVEFINDEDIVIANDAKLSEAQQSRKVIRCVNLKNLQNQPPDDTNVSQRPILPQPELIMHPQGFPQPPLPAPETQICPQLLSPTSSNSTSTASNTAVLSPRIAIQSYNPNFTGNCNVRPVKIFIRPNTTNMAMGALGNPWNSNFQFQR
ncbi:uncharacterized protein LOC118756391 [Rhagoletis pomonella]|uniref:uncharacterized protein LOC118756391 n=1 Tax=Rhagoletis pomonella TaxID=28610 RepID=UPI00177CD1AD|nr:uncharacterized protein LOC118756391 [Rhagoletis pomonella]